MSDTTSERHAGLHALLLDCELATDEPLADDTPLISSGALNSLGLFRVAVWIEEQTGQSVDPNTFDVAQAWDSIAAILNFVEYGADGETHAAPRDEGSIRRSRWHIVPYTSAYRDAVAQLQTELWSPDAARNLRYLEWRYEKNPCRAPSYIYLALDGDNIVGMRGFQPGQWESANGPHTFLVADDSVVRSDHRDQGVMDDIMRAALRDLAQRGVDYVFNFSGSPVTVLNSLAMGWRSIGAVEPIGDAPGTTSHLRDLFRNRVSNLLQRTPYLWRYAASPRMLSPREREPFVRLDRLLDRSLSVHDARLRVSKRIEADTVAALVQEIGHDGRLRMVRDADYLEWRFDNPLREYRFLYLEREGRLDGYLALKRNLAGDTAPVVHIVDLESRDDETERLLLETVTDRNFFHNLAVWSITLPMNCREFLLRRDFAPVTRQSHRRLLVRATDDAKLSSDWLLDGMSVTELANWDMRMLYTMAS